MAGVVPDAHVAAVPCAPARSDRHTPGSASGLDVATSRLPLSTLPFAFQSVLHLLCFQGTAARCCTVWLPALGFAEE